MITLYGDARSGNCHKIVQILDFTAQDWQWHKIDTTKHETRTPAFLAINPNGKIPAVKLADDRILWESHAILYYFAQGTPWFSDDTWEAGNILKWMMFEQYSLEPYIGSSRWWASVLCDKERYSDDLARCHQPGLRGLQVIDDHLGQQDFFATQYRPTIADIAIYGYTHVAHEGEFDMQKYKNIASWVARVQSNCGFCPMEPLAPLTI